MELITGVRFINKYEPVDYVIVISRPHLETIWMSRRNMANYVHLLAIDLRALQLVHEPLQLADWIRAVDQQPPVLVIAIIHIDGQNSEAWSNQDRVESTAAHSMGHTGRQPKSPVFIEFIVQPRDTVLFGHKGWRKAKKSGNEYRLLMKSF